MGASSWCHGLLVLQHELGEFVPPHEYFEDDSGVIGWGQGIVASELCVHVVRPLAGQPVMPLLLNACS